MEHDQQGTTPPQGTQPPPHTPEPTPPAPPTPPHIPDVDQSGKNMTISLNREKLVNVVLAVQVALLLLFGWQLYSIKQILVDGAPAKKIAKVDDDSSAAPSPSAAPSAAKAAADVKPPGEGDYFKGGKDSEITLIEYSDFECPFCQRFHPTAQQAVDDYDGQVNWVYRHFPLSFHPTAQKKAEAVECVGEQKGDDGYWELADALFEGTASAPITAFEADVKATGVDFAQYQDCLDTDKFADKVASVMATGTAAGVTGTPGTIVYNNETGDSRLVPGALPFASLKATIDSLLQ